MDTSTRVPGTTPLPVSVFGRVKRECCEFLLVFKTDSNKQNTVFCPQMMEHKARQMELEEQNQLALNKCREMEEEAEGLRTLVDDQAGHLECYRNKVSWTSKSPRGHWRHSGSSPLGHSATKSGAT